MTVTRTQLAIKRWSDQAQREAADRVELLERLAQAEMESEMLRAELEAIQATKATEQEAGAAAELGVELDLVRHLNADLQEQLTAMKERHEALTAEWQKQSNQLMALTLENNRLREAGGAPALEVKTEPKPKAGGKREVSKGIVRDCKTCGEAFTVSFRNRMYCGDACAPLTSSGEPRRAQPRVKKGKATA